MSLIRILLEDFNPDQKTIGGKRGLEKVRADLEKINAPDIDKQPKDKQDVLDMLDVNSEAVQDTLDRYLQNEYDPQDIMDQIEYSPQVMDTFEYLVDQYQGELGFEELFHVENAEELYRQERDQNPEDLDELKDFLDSVQLGIFDWQKILDHDWFEEIILEMAKDDIEHKIEDNLWELSETVGEAEKIDGRDCIKLYRAIRVNFKKGMTLKPEGGLGIYWSFMEEGAKAYSASMQGEDLIVYAWVPLSSVSWGETIYKNIWGLRHEKEVQLLTDHDIYIEKIRVDQSGFGGSKDPVKKKAKLIAKTYFKSKWENIKDDWGRKRQFIESIETYLKENNMASDKYSLTFDNYYKSKA